MSLEFGGPARVECEQKEQSARYHGTSWAKETPRGDRQDREKRGIHSSGAGFGRTWFTSQSIPFHLVEHGARKGNNCHGALSGDQLRPREITARTK